MSRLLLQICTAVLGLVPVLTGILTMRGSRDPLYRVLQLPKVPILDSNLRFFGGLWLGMGLAFLWMVPAIEQQGTLFRWLWGCIFLGGVGRLLSWLIIGAPPRPFIGFLLLEIVGAPLFVYWQWQLAQSFLAP
jgi:hypothetical protein